MIQSVLMTRKLLIVLFLASILTGCGGGEDKESNSSNPNVPEGAWKTQQTITNRYAPLGFTAAVVWVQAATMSKTQTNAPALIEVEYMRFVEEDPVSGRTVLADEQYNTAVINGLNLNQGALYDRSPTWFANDDHHIAMTNSTINNGLLKIDVSQTPNNIVHWWSERKTCKPTATYYIEMRVRITGAVGLQLGGDFWTTLTSSWNGYDVNNREYFASDWYGDTNGQFIDIKVPRL